jgi:pilus assembly protein CpaC
MPRFTAVRRGALVCAALCGLCWAPVCRAQSDDPSPPLSGDVVSILSPRTDLEIPERFAKVISFSKRIVRVDGFDPAVVAVTALTPQQLRIAALSQGMTNVLIYDEDGATFMVEVLVTGDARLLQAILSRTFPKTNVSAMKVRDSVLLRGWVTEPQDINNIVALAELYFPTVLNQMRVAGPQEVQLRVKVMEVQRSLIRKMGVNFAYFNENAAIISSPGPIAALTALTAPIGGTPSASFGSSGLQNSSLAVGFADANNAFIGLIEALKQEGLLKLHAETTLTTRNGEAARLENGGEFPIPVPQSLGTVTIQWREFGVILESLPIIISPTRLKQQVSVEVSERDSTTAVTLNGTTVPGLNKRKVRTQAEMNFGDTMVIGGLIFTRYTAATNKIPFLGELPGIGAAFRRNNFTEAETELLVMITPEFVSPLPCDQVPPGGPGLSTEIPTDRELYFQGAIEVPAYGGGRCAGGNCDPGLAPNTGYSPDMSIEVVPSPTDSVPSNSPNATPQQPTLISPPGVQAPPPPAPGAADPGMTRRAGSRTAWPSTSSPQQLSSRKPSSNNAASSGIRQAGYQNKVDRTTRRTGSVKNSVYPPAPSVPPSSTGSSLKTAQ